MVLALAYASSLMRRLQVEHARAERLAIRTERQRIGWELHDSAKQRTQAAHLLLSSLGGGLQGDAARGVVAQAMAELRQAALDMDASVSKEQPAILSGEALGPALRNRARQLAAAGRPIEVRGDAVRCPPTVAAHVYRIGGEALANAVRHADAANIEAELAETAERLVLTVRDDGLGMPSRVRPGASGLKSMENRAQSIGAVLTIAPAGQGPQPGTQVTLEVPLTTRTEEEP
jgi:signal transduction histidine kinase